MKARRSHIVEEGPGLGDLVAGRMTKIGVRLDPSVPVTIPADRNASLYMTHFLLYIPGLPQTRGPPASAS